MVGAVEALRVGPSEAVEAPLLNQALGGIEDPRRAPVFTSAWSLSAWTLRGLLLTG